jgi:hypothetical protein
MKSSHVTLLALLLACFQPALLVAAPADELKGKVSA